jgi:hypothetical protein
MVNGRGTNEMDAPMRAFLNDPYQKVAPPPDAVLRED